MNPVTIVLNARRQMHSLSLQLSQARVAAADTVVGYDLAMIAAAEANPDILPHLNPSTLPAKLEMDRAAAVYTIMKAAFLPYESVADSLLDAMPGLEDAVRAVEAENISELIAERMAHWQV
jgi:hypothetical protein